MSEAARILWSDYPLNRWMVLITIILLLASLNRFIYLLPYLFNTLLDWKANIRLEASVPRVRTRNFIAFIMAFPFCLIAGRYSLLSIETLKIVPASLSVLTVFGVMGAFLLLKNLTYYVLLPRNHTISCFKNARSSEANTFIVLVVVEMLTTGILTLFEVNDSTARLVILYEIGAFYLLLIVRKGQILSSACNHFSTFLYLCGLEILPIMVLITANIKY